MAQREGASPAVRRWGILGWTVWTVGAACGIVAALFAAFLVTWKAGPNCGNLATSATVRSGLTGLSASALILSSPWVLAAFLARRRWRQMVIGLIITVLPLAVVAATHTHPTDWNGGQFCF